MSTRTRRALTVGAATLAPLLVWTVAQLAGTDLIVTLPGQRSTEVAPPQILMTALVAGLAAWALIALLERLAGGRARMIWIAIAALALVLSLAMPLTVEAATAVTVSLVMMHLAVGAVLIPGLRQTVRGAASARTATAGEA